MTQEPKNPFKEIRILSEAIASETVLNEPKEWNVVSIWSGGGGKHGNSKPEHKNAKSICQQRFHDINSIEDGMIFCNEEHVKIILEYAKQHYTDKMIVHCHGGISRSSALAFLIFLDYYKDLVDDPVGFALESLVETKQPHLIYPNTYIISLGMHVICGENEQKEIQWNRDLYNHRIFHILYH